MSDTRHFRLSSDQGQVYISVDGKSLDETFELSPPGDLIYFLRSANLPSEEVGRILSELSIKGSSHFSLD